MEEIGAENVLVRSRKMSSGLVRDRRSQSSHVEGLPSLHTNPATLQPLWFRMPLGERKRAFREFGTAQSASIHYPTGSSQESCEAGLITPIF